MFFLNDVFCRLFEERCLRIMDGMYHEDPKHAIDLMDDEANIWGIHSSPLTFAHENFMYEIVAHTCSQKYINIQWYNDLAPDLVPFFKVHLPKTQKELKCTQCQHRFLCICLIFFHLFGYIFRLPKRGREISSLLHLRNTCLIM